MNDAAYLKRAIDLAALSKEPVGCASVLVDAHGNIVAEAFNTQRADNLTALIFAKVDRIVFAKRLNDFVTDERKIDIDCFEFVTKFPYRPKVEMITLD